MEDKVVLDIGEVISKINEFFAKNHESFFAYGVDDSILIDVPLGDWKHDHAYLNMLVRTFLLYYYNVCSDMYEIDIEEDGSDCYTSTHVYEDFSKFFYADSAEKELEHAREFVCRTNESLKF